MFKHSLKTFLVLFVLSTTTLYSSAQTAGEDILNTVNTAVPFLRIPPDARSGALGDAGIALSPDANALFFNPAKLVFNEKPLGLSVSYTPWLRELVNDIYLAHIGGYYKLDKLQAIGASIRYFSLGNITFTDASGGFIQDFRPNEFAVDLAYSRKLSDNFGVGLVLKFIYSNLATGQNVSGVTIKPGTSAAADISAYYEKEVEVSDRDAKIAFGVNISNVGAKITYTESAEKDFIPANLGIGGAFIMNLDDANQLQFVLDLNKLLVPTPDSTGSHRELGVAASILGSFTDAPDGAKEEFREIMYSTGLEYWYDQKFAIRAGYFYEHGTKGARQFFSAGLGLKYSVFGLNFSYLVPTSAQRHPLDNTLRFTLLFDFDAFKAEGEDKPKTM